MENTHESHIYTDPVSEAACPKCGEILGVENLPAFTSVECSKCSHAFQVPARFGPFLLLELLGAGGMGGVYLARDEGLNREVAIKVMLQSLGDDIDFVETFQREAQAAAKLNNPHIVQIYSFGQQYGQPYIVMELVPNGSLEDKMEEEGGVDPTFAIHVGAQIAEGLREAAEAGLVHGDVKPENILFDSEDNAKLVDFGLVALGTGNDNEVWGTPFYIAPEKVRRQKSDYRSDIYSLGATLYHVIANQPPFDGPDATAVVKARFERAPKSLSEVTGKEIPAEVEDLIARMLEVDPAKRYPTYGSLMGDMKRYLSKAGPVKKSSRRIKIKGKDAMKFSRNKDTMSIARNGAGNAGGDAATPSDLETSPQAQGCKTMAVAAVLIFLALIIIGAAVWFVMDMNRRKADENKVLQMQSEQFKIITAVENSLVIARKNTDTIIQNATEAMKIAQAADAQVVAVLGEEVRARMVPPEPEYVVPGSSPTPVEEATDTAAAAEGEPAKEDAPAAAEAPAVAGGEVPREDDHQVIKLVRSMYEDAYAVKLGGVVAGQIVAEVEATLAQLEMLKADPLNYVQMGQVGNEATLRVRGMAVCPEIKEANARFLNLQKIGKNVKDDLASMVAQKRLEEKEREKQEQIAAEAEKKRLAEEALREKEQNEIARIAVAEGESFVLVKSLRFRDALRLLNNVADEIESDVGHNALLIAKERVNRIKNFHDYLVAKTPGFKSARGWSVTEADQRNLVVGNKKVSWEEVYSSQPERIIIVAEFIGTLVLSAEAKKELRLREHTTLMTNAALFLSTFYTDTQSAQDQAGKIAHEAVKQFPADEHIIKELLPNFFE
ncbi:MAG: serine/threonine-protein kinase [Kiritimatiellae bacterium]|nr:serine/threonine-protein kinase [Kiritimatiellia bacterium]